MHHVMFDVDGTLVESLTLVESFKFDEECYLDAVYKVLGHNLDNDWSKYPHMSDAGILDYHLQQKNMLIDRDEVHSKVKLLFIVNIKNHLMKYPVKQIEGAAEFISFLRKQDNVSLSIATGGWGETAKLKLVSAGIDILGIPMSSSNDHFSRTEIMKLALCKADVSSEHKLTYFGDAEWDKKACEVLKFNFVLVGHRFDHAQKISDFVSTEQACHFIGL